MQKQPDHSEILTAIGELRKEVNPLVEIAPQLKAMSEIYSAGKVGGNAIKWIGMIGAAALTVIAFFKLAAAGFARMVIP